MNANQLAVLGIRVFVIWYAISLIRELPPSFMADVQHVGTIASTKIAIAIVAVVLGVILWFTSGPLARMLIPRADSQVPTQWSEAQVRSVGASLIGLWVIAYSMHPIILYGTLWFLTRSGGMSGWETSHTVSLVSALAIFGIGLWLFLGARGLWHVWSRLRGQTKD